MSVITRQDILQLFIQLSNGSIQAFGQLYTFYSPLLLAQLHPILPGHDLAQLAFQETMELLWEKRSHVGKMQKPEAWLFTCARRRAINLLRNEKRKTTKELHEAQLILPLPWLTLEEKAISIRIRHAIAQLPAQQQRILLLQHEAGLNRKQIAAACQLSEHTVRNHLAKAYKQLRTLLSNLDTG